MPLPMNAKAHPRGQSQVGRSPVLQGRRRGKVAMELRRFARNAQSPVVMRMSPLARRLMNRHMGPR